MIKLIFMRSSHTVTQFSTQPKNNGNIKINGLEGYYGLDAKSLRTYYVVYIGPYKYCIYINVKAKT